MRHSVGTHLSPYSSGLVRHCVQASWNHWPQLPHCNIFRFHLRLDSTQSSRKHTHTQTHAGTHAHTHARSTHERTKQRNSSFEPPVTSLYSCIINNRVKGWWLWLPLHVSSTEMAESSGAKQAEQSHQELAQIWQLAVCSHDPTCLKEAAVGVVLFRPGSWSDSIHKAWCSCWQC